MTGFKPLKASLDDQRNHVCDTYFVQATCMEAVLAGLTRLLWEAVVHDTDNPATR